MKPHLYAGAVAALALLGAPAAALESNPAPAGQRITIQGQKNPSAWFRAESQHFIVYANTSQQAVAELLHNLERLDFLLRVYTKAYFKEQQYEPKLTLYYHERLGTFSWNADPAPANAVGVYSSCTANVQAAAVAFDAIAQLDNARLTSAPANNTLGFLFEGYARHFLYRHTDVRAPLHFIEGFAQYFANVRFSDNQMVVGMSPLDMKRYLNFLEEGNPYSLDYEDVLHDNDSKGRNPAGESGIKLEFTARSWLLTHYMLSSEDNRLRLARYLNLANRDVPARKAFETAFGIKVGDLGEKLWRYRLTSVKVLQVEVPNLPAAHIAFTSLPDTVTNYVMMDATLKSCPGRAAGEALLGKLAGRSGEIPNHPLARLALSRAQVEWGNPQDAIPALAAMVRDNQQDSEARYLLGLAHLRAARSLQGAARDTHLETARTHLVDAVNANPSSAEAAYALLRTELETGDVLTETAMTAAELAWANAREVSEYGRMAALMYAYAGNSAKSRQALNVLAHDRRSPAMAEWATQWQARLAAGVDRAELLAELRRAPADAPVREWTMAHDSVMQEVIRSSGAEKLRDYLKSQPVKMDTPDSSPRGAPNSR